MDNQKQTHQQEDHNMSCGPSKELLAVADQIDALNAQLDAAIMDIPGMGELAGLKGKVEGEAQKLKDKLSAALPSISFPNVPFGQQSLQDQIKSVAGLIALGIAGKDQLENQIDFLKAKYSGMDVDIDNIADLLRQGAMDLDSICKMVPNIQTQGIDLTVKGIPTSFPDIDPVAIIRGNPVPEMPSIDNVYIDKNVRSKEQAEEFLNIELPNFDF